jgi:hypothetical protein
MRFIKFHKNIIISNYNGILFGRPLPLGRNYYPRESTLAKKPWIKKSSMQAPQSREKRAETNSVNRAERRV